MKRFREYLRKVLRSKWWDNFGIYFVIFCDGICAATESGIMSVLYVVSAILLWGYHMYRRQKQEQQTKADVYLDGYRHGYKVGVSEK